MGEATFISRPTSNVRVAREARGVSFEDLCAQGPFDPARLAELERYPDPATPTAPELVRLGFLLHFPLAFFSLPIDPQPFTGWIHGTGIKPCALCGHVAAYLCDWPIGNGKTCDLDLCEDHRGHQDNGQDYCPAHAALLLRWGPPPPRPPPPPGRPPFKMTPPKPPATTPPATQLPLFRPPRRTP